MTAAAALAPRRTRTLSALAIALTPAGLTLLIAFARLTIGSSPRAALCLAAFPRAIRLHAPALLTIRPASRAICRAPASRPLAVASRPVSRRSA